MNIKVKQIYTKMVDFHYFATVLLAVGAFLYLGVVIPDIATTTISQMVGLGGSLLLLTGSAYFFWQSKKLRKILEETDEGQEYLSKK